MGNSIFMAQNTALLKIKGYGYLYNWFTINGNETNLITDLHVPTTTEWDTLSTYLGGDSISGGKLKEIGLVHWDSPNTDAVNLVGFTALGNGSRAAGNGSFDQLKFDGYAWTQSVSTTFGVIRALYSFNATISAALNVGKEMGGAIRCMRVLTAQEQIDFIDGELVESKTDYDGNSYNVIRIGTQGWTTTNLKTTTLLDSTSIPNVTDNTAWTELTTIGRCAYDNDENNV